jgi:hypothetical protein
VLLKIGIEEAAEQNAASMQENDCPQTISDMRNLLCIDCGYDTIKGNPRLPETEPGIS